ncbi:N-acetyltransferase [Jannaschia pagri]|uniref:N-acetyltransferase n=1 Tax=Jannaschia pagri TaxID=2829797 RepID=A0ABQ4NNH1_9RHOB|nr:MULTISPECIES: GNAT family protein [unclassified Jannaschia]GIT92111.1 N-acetyltransferase [Jannaschia sp. AI_61]GIT95946.1 N-acetyltransferase [Jannaschia sp. AI_62]
MPDLPILTGPNISLRAPQDGDAETMVALGRDPEITKWSGLKPGTLPPLDRAWATGWLAEVSASVSWVIARCGTFIGAIRLMDVWPAEGHARVAMGLQSSRDTGKGYGREALGLVLGYAFDTLGLHRVGLRVMVTNAAAIRCYEACGFVVEGREREACWTPDGRVDDLVMGLLAPDWRAAR